MLSNWITVLSSGIVTPFAMTLVKNDARKKITQVLKHTGLIPNNLNLKCIF